MMVSSRKTSQRPRFNRNMESSCLLFLRPIKNAEVPARKINTGAQKWVIHRVKKSTTLVLLMSVGSYRNASA